MSESKSKPNPDELQSDLDQFIGGGDLTCHWTRRILFTEGIHYLAEQAGAFWLIDAVASYQPEAVIRESGRLQSFQLWRLEVADRKAVLECREDSGQPAKIRQEIEYSDFPLTEFECFVVGGVMMLKNEY